MDNKLLEELITMGNERLPQWGKMKILMRLAGEDFIRGERVAHLTSKELKLMLELEAKDRIIASLTKKPKKKIVEAE